jgi:hypothetical protein
VYIFENSHISPPGEGGVSIVVMEKKGENGNNKKKGKGNGNGKI